MHDDYATETAAPRKGATRAVLATAQDPSVGTMLADLERVITGVQEELSALFDRIEPVLVPPGPSEALRGIDDGAPMSPIAANIQQAVSTLERVMFGVRDVRGRVNL